MKTQTRSSFLLSILALAAARAVAAPTMVSDPHDVMAGVMPKLPAFAKLARKPGYIRGWVKDINGKPLKGAHVEIGSTAIGGAKTYVTAKSDARGLYEIELPLGSCEIRGAGAVVTFQGIRCSLPLHPVDGETDFFASRKGDVENFVLLPYGVANEGGASEDPHMAIYYYGASIQLVFWNASGSGTLPTASKMRLTMTPRGALMDGSKGRAFVIEHEVTERDDPGVINVNNIPPGQYDIRAEMVQDGRATPLLLEDRAFERRDGLKPKSASGTATLLPSPKTGAANLATTFVSGWQPVSINLKTAGADSE